MQTLKTQVIVLRRTNYGESDRIVQFITPHDGKVSAIAKAVRREKSKLASSIELLSVSDVVITKGKSDLGILTSARLVVFYADIMKDYDRLEFSYEAIKNISRLAEHVPEMSLFDLAKTLLESLNNLKIDLRIIKTWFYLQVAEAHGHGLNLSRDDNNEPLREDAQYRFDISEMAFAQHKNGTITASHLKLLKILKLKSPEVIAHVSGIGAYLDDCVSLARAVAE